MTELRTIDDIDADILPLGDTETVKVGGRIRVALEAMVYEGRTVKEAATVSGLPLRSLYNMLGQPRYAQAYSEMLKVRRQSTRARTLHRLEELRDQDENRNAAVAAARVLENVDAKAPQVTVNVNPGWVIDLSGFADELGPAHVGHVIELGAAFPRRSDSRQGSAPMVSISVPQGLDRGRAVALAPRAAS
jgi:hypothetical protein